MHPADHYPVTQALFQSEDALTLGDQSELEATIASLKQRFEAIRQHEVKRVCGRLVMLSSTQQNAIESLTHRIVDQILEAPITVLKAALEDDDSCVVIKTVQRVFSLGDEPDPLRAT